MEYRNKKRLQIINYIFKKLAVDELQKEFVIKLVYLADKLFLLKYGCTITSDKLMAFQRGPACSQTLAILDRDEEHIEDNDSAVVKTFNNVYEVSLRERTQKVHTIFPKNLPDNLSALSENEKNVLDIIIDRFGHTRYEELSDYTHTFKEWKKFSSCFEDDTHAEEMDIKDIFEDKVFLGDKVLSRYLNPEMIQNSALIYNGEF